MCVSHGAIQARRFRAEEYNRWQLKESGKMSRAAVVSDHESSHRVQCQQFPEVCLASEIYAAAILDLF